MSAHEMAERCGRVPGLACPGKAGVGCWECWTQLPSSSPSIMGMSGVVCPPWPQCCRTNTSVTLNCSSLKWALASA